MKIITVNTCFECPFCIPGSYVEGRELHNSFKCRKTGVFLEDVRNSIDFRCDLDSFYEQEFNLITIMKQTYLDIESEYESSGELEEKDRIIYEFLKDTLDFLDR